MNSEVVLLGGGEFAVDDSATASCDEASCLLRLNECGFGPQGDGTTITAGRPDVDALSAWAPNRFVNRTMLRCVNSFDVL